MNIFKKKISTESTFREDLKHCLNLKEITLAINGHLSTVEISQKNREPLISKMDEFVGVVHSNWHRELQVPAKMYPSEVDKEDYLGELLIVKRYWLEEVAKESYPIDPSYSVHAYLNDSSKTILNTLTDEFRYGLFTKLRFLHVTLGLDEKISEQALCSIDELTKIKIPITRIWISNKTPLPSTPVGFTKWLND
jgi:hypothetical protein